MKYIAKTFAGLESVLEKELIELGAENTRVSKRAVAFSGSKELMYIANYRCRTALSILIPIASFKIEGNDDLYDQSKAINWLEYMDLSTTFAITCNCYSNLFKHSNYPALLLKDAIADHFRDKMGDRPNVDTYDPDLDIDLFIAGDTVFVSLDSSGEALFKRNYREGEHPAPINEVLAAGLVRLSKWDPLQPLLDPMCGSGTIIIEAAMAAYNIPAGLLRKKWGFMNWKDFDQEMWNKVTAPTEINTIETDIWGSDISRKNIDTARASLNKLGIGSKVKLLTNDFLLSSPIAKRGVIICNPPYGERLKTGNIGAFFNSMGRHLKDNYFSWNVWFISPNRGQLRQLRMQPADSFEVLNGDIDCVFQRFLINERDPQKEVAPVYKHKQIVMRSRRKPDTGAAENPETTEKTED